MVQAVSAASNQANPFAGVRTSAQAQASPYAADWRTPATPLAPVNVAAPRAAPSSASDLTARAKENAQLSAHVYQSADTPPPAGFRVAGEQELQDLGITPQMLEQPGSSFRARVYATEEGGKTRYVVAFRGSSSGEDWKNNFQQGIGLDSESYAKALQIGRTLARSDADVVLTGHSLGGGLASAAAIASGREADTFNAAGLHDDTIADARQVAASYGRGDAPVQAYHVPGEILTFVQTGGDRLAGGLLGTIFGGPIGGIAGVFAADAPPAYGISHELPNAMPEGKGWIDEHSRIDRHMIDWVLAGAAAL